MDEERPLEVTKRKNGDLGKKIFSVVLIIVISAAAGFGGGIAALNYGEGLLTGNSMQKEITVKTNDSINTAEVVAKKLIPSVVGISTTSKVTYQSWFGVQTGVTEGVGTGIIVDEKGYILTNSHVVNDGAVDAITVQLYDGSEVKGTVLWNDRSIDLAIVKIVASDLTAADLGDSEDVQIGSFAVAIGNPLGLAFDSSVTQGIISGLNRSITVTDGQNAIVMEGLIQTDASINSGNSGGPLLNSKGEVIGINSAKVQGGEGIGFAIPINIAKPIVEEIKTKGEFTRAYIGIQGVSMSEFLQSYPDENLGTKTGAYVIQIFTGSPAFNAGLREGDIIVGLGNKTIETMTQLISGLYQYRPGDVVELKVIRNSKAITINVTLTEQ